MHALFDRQPRFSEEELVQYAREIGLDVDRFNRDRSDPAVIARVEANGREAGRLGVANTPAVVLNGKTYQGGRDFDFYAGLVADALGQAPARSANPRSESPPVTWNDMIFPVSPLEPVTAKPILRVGDAAPDFTLPGACGRTFHLSDYRGKQNVILSFVPAAFTPVCSGQWPHYIARKDALDALDTVVLGITTDNVPSLWAWTRGMEGLNFPVLSDFWPHGATAAKYGVLRPESGTTERALFLVDKKGTIRYIDIHDINTEPDMEPLMKVVETLASKK
ncbi:redoxin domain-containing protein [Candidatus Sumerlaeota bacterium]|nr:redoxin domain-containing protein [Candidatus Sumerlaeota bacterium]